jgi:hypothetical protein
MKQDIIDTYLDYADGHIKFLESKFDKAILGIEQETFRVAYSRKKILKILTKELGNKFEATEYAEFNIFDSKGGDRLPIIIDDEF